MYTTLDLRLQQAAKQAVRNGVVAIDRRHGFQGALRHLALTGYPEQDRALIESVTRPSETDPALREGEKETADQGAKIVILHNRRDIESQFLISIINPGAERDL